MPTALGNWTRLEWLEKEVRRLKKRLTHGGGGVPPSTHASSHQAGGSDELTLGILQVLTADPVSPDDDTAWVKRSSSAPYEISLCVRIDGVTHEIPLYTTGT